MNQQQKNVFVKGRDGQFVKVLVSPSGFKPLPTDNCIPSLTSFISSMSDSSSTSFPSSSAVNIKSMSCAATVPILADDSIFPPFTGKEEVADASHKEKFEWNTKATLSLLAAYESANSKLDPNFKKKNSKFWASIAAELNSIPGVTEGKLSGDQVRWKWNSLISTYRKVKDANRRNGSSHMGFPFFDRMQEIVGDRPITLIRTRQKLNLPLEKQFSNHMDRLVTSAAERSAYMAEKRKWKEEELRLKNEWLELKKRKYQLKEAAEERKRMEREKRYNERLEIEKEKVRILERLLQERECLQ